MPLSKLTSTVAFGLIACILYGVGAGLRSDIGILVSPLASHCGLEYDDVSLCVAIMQLVFGAAQPVFGVIASKKSNRYVLLTGVILLGLSMVGMILSHSYAALMLSLGVLFGLRAGALAFGLVLSSAIRFVGQESAMIISGMLNAAAGMVGFMLSPALQSLLDAGGLTVTLEAMIGLAALRVPVIFVVTARDKVSDESARETADTGALSLLRTGQRTVQRQQGGNAHRCAILRPPDRRIFQRLAGRHLAAGPGRLHGGMDDRPGPVRLCLPHEFEDKSECIFPLKYLSQEAFVMRFSPVSQACSSRGSMFSSRAKDFFFMPKLWRSA
jgi:hypothetical protein